MPLWKFYHPENAFTAEDKQAIAERITRIYSILPKFYVGVVFQAVGKDSFFIGGEPADETTAVGEQARLGVTRLRLNEGRLTRRFRLLPERT